MNPSRAEILVVLTTYLDELFEVPKERVTLDALLAEDLDLDSIDAVDLVVKLRDYSGQKISPAAFKKVRTVGDVVEQIYAQIKA